MTDHEAEVRKVAEDAYWSFRKIVDVDGIDGCEHTADSMICGHCEADIFARVLQSFLLAYVQRVREPLEKELEQNRDWLEKRILEVGSLRAALAEAVESWRLLSESARKHAAEAEDTAAALRAQLAEAVKKERATDALFKMATTQLAEAVEGKREEEEKLAALETRCFEGYPSISEGVFDALKAAEEQARSARARVEELEKALHEAKALSNLGYNIRHAEGCENETDESDVTASEYQQEHDALLRRIDAVIIRPDSRPEAHTPEPKP